MGPCSTKPFEGMKVGAAKLAITLLPGEPGRAFPSSLLCWCTMSKQ